MSETKLPNGVKRAADLGKKPDLTLKQNERSRIKKVIGVVSGKGGVGKSTITNLLACQAAREGFKTAIFDADITGPSVPRAFGLSSGVLQEDKFIIPAETKTGIKVMSINLLLPHSDDPVIWRGPILANVIGQFWNDVAWGDVDYMFVDMPPGTGDVPLTVFQSLPLSGIVLITTPQELVSMIVKKAYNMSRLMQVEVLGLVENMSYFDCDCGKRHEIFGASRLLSAAQELSASALGRLPINPLAAELSDAGRIEDFYSDEIAKIFKKIK